jgi:hypothetical protein
MNVALGGELRDAIVGVGRTGLGLRRRHLSRRRQNLQPRLSRLTSALPEGSDLDDEDQRLAFEHAAVRSEYVNRGAEIRAPRLSSCCDAGGASRSPKPCPKTRMPRPPSLM